MRIRGVEVLVVLALMTSFAAAGSTTGEPNNGLETKYSASDFVKGWVNISIESEPLSSLFFDNFENSINIKSLLDLNKNLNYTCNPNDCKSDYSESNAQTSKTFTLNKNEGKILGFKFTGSNFDVASTFSMNISSNAPESTSKQLFVDVLNDDKAEWKSYKASNNFYDENLGCYETPLEDVFVYSQDYCEKMTLPVSPNIEIGAYVTKASGTNAVFTLSLDGGGVSASCDVTASESGRISCVPNAKIDKNQEYTVCIKTKTSADDNKFRISSETTSPCGYAIDESNKRDFKIFAKSGKFTPVGTFTLNSAESENSGNGGSLEGIIENYMSRYNDDCSSGCVVPVRFVSQTDSQQITISGSSIFYVSEGTPKETKDIYDLSETSAVMNSGFQKIYIDDANFSVTGDPGTEKEYVLNLGNGEILSETISFKEGVRINSISPKTAIAGYPANFILNVNNSGLNITGYEWDFGNSSKETTSKNEVAHTYASVGNFELTVKVKTLEGVSVSKTFSIDVKTPKEAINSVLGGKISDLNNVNSQIKALPDFYQPAMKQILNLTSIESGLASMQKRNASAQTDGDYVSIMNDLVKIEVPNSVFKSAKAESLPFTFSEDYVNVSLLSDLSKETYEPGQERLYKKAVVRWDLDNINSTVSFSEFSAQYEDSVKRVLNTFAISINPSSESGDFYFVVKSLEEMEFKEEYGERNLLGNNYINLGSEAKTIEFSTTEDVDFSNLPMFISPEIKKLSTEGIDITLVEPEVKSKTLLVLLIIFVIVIGFTAYLVLQEWYKRKYEDYLFQNKNNLYNIVSYIENSKKKGMGEDDIAEGLKKAGWNSEQVTYVMKKYVGKRTGMLEIIPIDKIMGIFRKNAENGVSPKNH